MKRITLFIIKLFICLLLTVFVWFIPMLMTLMFGTSIMDHLFSSDIFSTAPVIFTLLALTVRYCAKVHQERVRISLKNAPPIFLCKLLNSPRLTEQILDAMHGNYLENQKAFPQRRLISKTNIGTVRIKSSYSKKTFNNHRSTQVSA